MKNEINIYWLWMHFPQPEYNEVCNLIKFSLGISIPWKFLLEPRSPPIDSTARYRHTIILWIRKETLTIQTETKFLIWHFGLVSRPSSEFKTKQIKQHKTNSLPLISHLSTDRIIITSHFTPLSNVDKITTTGIY